MCFGIFQAPPRASKQKKRMGLVFEGLRVLGFGFRVLGKNRTSGISFNRKSYRQSKKWLVTVSAALELALPSTSADFFNVGLGLR